MINRICPSITHYALLSEPAADPTLRLRSFLFHCLIKLIHSASQILASLFSIFIQFLLGIRAVSL